MNGSQLEEAWRSFFRGSHTFFSVKGYHATLPGQEEGVDLFLPPVYRQILPSGMIQVKPGIGFAIDFLIAGIHRKKIIPVIIGAPHDNTSPEDVLQILNHEFVYLGQTSIELSQQSAGLSMLGYCIYQITNSGLKLRTKRPAWASNLD